MRRKNKESHHTYQCHCEKKVKVAFDTTGILQTPKCTIYRLSIIVESHRHTVIQNNSQFGSSELNAAHP